MNIEKFDHVGIRITERERAVQFYEALGFEIEVEVDFDSVIIMKNSNGVEINLVVNGTTATAKMNYDGIYTEFVSEDFQLSLMDTHKIEILMKSDFDFNVGDMFNWKTIDFETMEVSDERDKIVEIGEKFLDGINKTFVWYMNNKKYYRSLNKKDIIKRMGKI